MIKRQSQGPANILVSIFSRVYVRMREAMCRPLSLLFIGLLFAAAPATASHQTCPYEGKALVRVDGQAPPYFPSRLTVLSDGHSIIVTSEVTGRLGHKYISTSVLRGSFDGNVFIGSSRERFNLRVHQYSATQHFCECRALDLRQIVWHPAN
jgi:hypothetical protein